MLVLSACLPSSDDLGEYSARWGEPPAAQQAPPIQAAGAGGAVAEPSGDAGSSGSSEGPPSSVPLDPASGEGALADASGSAGAGGSSGSPPLPSGATPAEQCGDGVLDDAETSCYRVATAPATWQAARSACVSWGGELVEVETSAEDQLLAGLVAQDLWLGASDLGVENVFVWNDGSPILFGNWGPAQPDRFPGPDCIQKRSTEGRAWFDQPCDNSWLYICERAIVR